MPGASRFWAPSPFVRINVLFGLTVTSDSGQVGYFGVSRDSGWYPLFICQYFVRLWPLKHGDNVISELYSINRAASWDEGRRFLLEIYALEAVFCAVSRSPSQRKRTF